MITRPMLAVPVDFHKLKFPVLATPKLDGIRCLTITPTQERDDLFGSPKRCSAVTRKFLSLPNTFVRSWIEANLPPGLDGELMLAGTVTFQDISSAFMSEWGEPDFVYNVFDYVPSPEHLKTAYALRVDMLTNLHLTLDNAPLKPNNIYGKVYCLYPRELKGLEEITEYEQECIAAGYEGLILRSPQSPYKLGRSTVNEGYMLKVKRFVDDEARVVGFTELQRNHNEKTDDAFGHAKRSSHKANLVAGGTLGTLDCVTKNDVPFSIGTGFSQQQRDDIWSCQSAYIGRWVKFKYQKVGMLTKPRCPVFLGFRDVRDI